MNVVFSIRFFLVSMTTILLIAIPRMLYYFGARADALDAILSPWFTFIIVVIVGCLATYTLLKNIKLAVFVFLAVLAVAVVSTFYLCNLALPW